MEAVVRPRMGEDSVSSVVGTILMLAITVSVFGGLSIVVLAEVRSNEPPPEADLAFTAEGTRAILAHRGGEPIPLSGSALLLNIGGAELRYEMTDPAIAGQTADGKTWRIGETLCLSGASPPDPARTCLVAARPILGVAIIARGGLVADEGERGGDAGPCVLDSVAPTVPLGWTFAPADVVTTTTGTVTVGFTATDDCIGMDDSAEPTLFYRINDGSPSPPEFTSLGQMANTGPGEWSGVVPSQPWNLLGGKTLEVYATGLQDANGNQAGATAYGTETIESVMLVQYVSGATEPPAQGTISALEPARVEGDLDAATTLTEGGTSVPAGTGGPTKFGGTTAVTGGALNEADALTSNDVHATLDTSAPVADYIEVSGFDLPSNAASITSLTIGYEGRKTGSGSSPTTRLDYKLGAGAYSTGASITESATTNDVDRTRSLCTTQATCTSGSFTVANVEAMTVRVFHVTDQTPNVLVDHVFLTVTYTTAAMTTYSLDVELQFQGTADGSSETLELRYKTSGDTYQVEVWDGTSFVPHGTLSSPGSFTVFQYQLATAGELNGGTPRVRFVDVTPTGTVAGTLELDYAKMVTV